MKNINWVREGPGYPSLMRGGQEGLPQCQRRESAVWGESIWDLTSTSTFIILPCLIRDHQFTFIEIFSYEQKMYSVLYGKVSPGSDGEPGQSLSLEIT